MRVISVSLFILFLFTTVLFQNCGGISVSPTGIVEIDSGDDPLTDPCENLNIGEALPSNVVCAGTFRNHKYMLAPAGCNTNVTNNPSCNGLLDSGQKTWNGSTGTSTNITALEDITDATLISNQTGKDSTSAIILSASTSADSAANYCDQLVYGGYNDWFLPSKSEMTYFYCNSSESVNRTAGSPQESPSCDGDYNGPSTVFTGFAAGVYWTSTEFSVDLAWYISFVTGTDSGQLNRMNKITPRYMRCARLY